MSVGRLALRLLLVAAVGGAAALSLHGYEHSIGHTVEARYRRDLRHLDALEARLDREVLRSRAGLVLHYDALTEAFRELRQTARGVSVVPAELGFDPGPELSAALARITRLVDEDEVIIERFKSVNAILRNSRQYYPVVLDQLRARLEAEPGADRLRPGLEAVVGALGRFDASPARDAVSRLSSSLAELERSSRGLGARVPDEVGVVLAHGALVVEHSAAVDGLVAQALAMPLSDEIGRAVVSYERSYVAALHRGQLHVSLLAALVATAILLGSAELIARARADARALRQARDELERANQALERERAREQQQNELKTRFVSATSHEFRTPLTTILSSSQMLATYGERWDAERRQTHFERITTAAFHMTEMLEEILLIGRAEMGVLAANPVELDLHEFCRTLVEGLSRAAQRSGAVELSLAGERWVQLDRRLLTHVLGNLVENALKYSEPASTVRLSVTVRDSGVECVVEDTGIGMAEADIPHLFDSFYRGQNVGTVAGTGLGLAVVKRAIDVQGGSIEVQSDYGRGTVVRVWLPLDAGAAISSAASARVLPTPDSAMGGAAGLMKTEARLDAAEARAVAPGPAPSASARSIVRNA
jgi:signal transduction histidine kinase